MFGMVISYTVKVKLYLGAMGGEVTAELPFVLMHPKVRIKGWQFLVFVMFRWWYKWYEELYRYNLSILKKNKLVGPGLT